MQDRRRVSSRVASIKKSAIHEMTRLSKEVEDVAFLSWAKPTSDTPEHIKEAAITAIREGKVGGYSENAGLPELREEIARKLVRDNGIDADPSEVIVTVGAIEGLFDAVMAAIDPGDEVILPSPTYSTHIRQVVTASGKPVLVPSIEEAGFALDIEGIGKAVTPRTRAIMYCSPCNPTGTVYSREQLRQLAEIALENNLMVITDEAYEYFVYDGEEHFSIGSIPEIGKVHIPSAICAPVVSQYAALAALQGSQDCVAAFREHYLYTRNLMCERLDRLPTAFAYHKPRGSYLMFPRILTEEGRDSTAFCKRLLKEGRVSATPGVAFGPSGEGHMRLSFCVSEEEINKAFDRMEDYLA